MPRSSFCIMDLPTLQTIPFLHTGEFMLAQPRRNGLAHTDSVLAYGQRDSASRPQDEPMLARDRYLQLSQWHSNDVYLPSRTIWSYTKPRCSWPKMQSEKPVMIRKYATHKKNEENSSAINSTYILQSLRQILNHHLKALLSYRCLHTFQVTC